jgi:O-antigen polysaccharide polymerase Wzy
MQASNAANPVRTSPVLMNAGVPLLVTAVLWATSINEIQLAQIIAAFLLCWIPWASYRGWNHGKREGIPLFALVSAMYWLGYAVPLFWLRHDINLVTGNHELSEDAITRSLYLAALGVAALWAGIRVTRSWRFMESFRPDIHRSPARWHYLRFAMLATMSLRIAVPIDAFGGGARQFLAIVEIIVSSITFVILLRYYLRGSAIPLDKTLLAGYVVVALVGGIASGWMGSFVGLAIMATGVYVYERGKLPLVAVVMGISIILFLQPGKNKFRSEYWREGASDSYIERFNFWMDASWGEWGRALSSSDEGESKNLAKQTIGRLSLLEQTANVMEATPERVPYQYGRLYSYMLITLVPRFLWADKPSVNDANQWYQVSYRLTNPRDLRKVSIATGYLTESYINFGWLGPPLVIFSVGIFLGLFEKVFLRPGAGLLMTSIGVVLLPQLLQVESQLAQYIGGLGQQVAVALITLAPMFNLQRNEAHRGRQVSLIGGANYKHGRLVLGRNR